jgi:hypothetical protein
VDQDDGVRELAGIAEKIAVLRDRRVLPEGGRFHAGIKQPPGTFECVAPLVGENKFQRSRQQMAIAAQPIGVAIVEFDLELAGLRLRRTAAVPQGRQDGAESLRIVGFAVAAEVESDRIEIDDELGLGVRHRRQRDLDLREIIEQRLQTLPLGFVGQRLGRRVGGNRHPQYRDDLVGRRAQAIAILPLSEMFERLCKTDHSETEPGFIVLRVGGHASRQVGLAGLEMAALQGLPRDIRGDSGERGAGR